MSLSMITLDETSFQLAGRYGVFSYGHSQIDAVAKYVMNQEQHHQKKTFRQEYLAFLDKFQIPFEEQYLFEFL